MIPLSSSLFLISFYSWDLLISSHLFYFFSFFPSDLLLFDICSLPSLLSFFVLFRSSSTPAIYFLPSLLSSSTPPRFLVFSLSIVKPSLLVSIYLSIHSLSSPIAFPSLPYHPNTVSIPSWPSFLRSLPFHPFPFLLYILTRFLSLSGLSSFFPFLPIPSLLFPPIVTLHLSLPSSSPFLSPSLSLRPSDLS